MDVFQQQGQLDYVAMSNSILSCSLAMSQRLAAAGISQITHQAGLTMSTRFRLGQMGQMRVSEALRNLRQYFGFERVLWFGFGHKSFLTLLTEHQAGVNCAALCASLSEAYGIDQSAHCLQTLWRVQGLSDTLEPSRSQFRALVNGCSGLLLATPYPDVLRRMAGPCADEDYKPVSVVNVRSEDWAKAVDAIFQISKGNLKAIRVYGGRHIAFLGAIAHWLFDLRVWVELPDGKITFSSCRSPEQANVYLHYANTEEASSALLRISSTTFVLRSVEDLLVDDRSCRLTFRIQWKSCLSELFHDEMDKILRDVVLIGKVLGGIARIYEALIKCEVEVGGLSRTHFINHQPAGHGRGFIDNICNLFPEIGNSTFRTTALKALQSDVSTCIDEICNSIEEMIRFCNCPACSGNTYDKQKCEVAVLLFIRFVANVLSHTDIKTPINPSRGGLIYIYSECLAARERESMKESHSFLELASGLPHQSSLPSTESLPSSNYSLLDSLLQGAARIFDGHAHNKQFGDSPLDPDQPRCTAIVKNGLCLWIGALQNLSADPASMASIHIAPASMASIHIAPGQIMYKHWTYNSIWDPSHARDKIYSSLSSVDFGEAPTTTLQKEPDQPHYAPRILAQERAELGTIRLVYEFNEETVEWTLQPGIITEELLLAMARVPCPQGTTCSDEIALPCWQRRSGWNFEGTANKSLHQNPGEIHLAGFIWNVSSLISKLLAIEGCRTLAWKRHKPCFNSSAILMRSDQCLSCMTRYIETFAGHRTLDYIHYDRAKPKYSSMTEKHWVCSFHII